jgi:hypothetical protein
MHVQRDKVRAFHACLLGEWVVRVRETAYPIYNPALLISSIELATAFLSGFRHWPDKMAEKFKL